MTLENPVLIVDDDLDIREALTELLEDRGFQVISAGGNGVFGPGDNWTPSVVAPDGSLTPAAGEWASGGSGADDLSNFNNGTLSGQR